MSIVPALVSTAMNVVNSSYISTDVSGVKRGFLTCMDVQDGRDVWVLVVGWRCGGEGCLVDRATTRVRPYAYAAPLLCGGEGVMKDNEGDGFELRGC